MRDSNFNIVVGEFSGSLETLLEMIKRRKLHISDVSLAKVADDYVAYAQNLNAVDSAEVANFIVIAATLLLIKSKSLLPNLELTIEEEDSIKDLEDRLGLYKIYKYASESLSEQVNINKRLYAPKYIKMGSNVFAPPQSLDISSLNEAMDDVLNQLPKVNKKPKAEVEEKINIKEVMHSLLQRVESSAQQSFTNLSGKSKQEVLVNFLALLELIKDGVLLARQDDTYGEIIIDR